MSFRVKRESNGIIRMGVIHQAPQGTPEGWRPFFVSYENRTKNAFSSSSLTPSVMALETSVAHLNMLYFF